MKVTANQNERMVKITFARSSNHKPGQSKVFYGRRFTAKHW
jgi:hypothetical protein